MAREATLVMAPRNTKLGAWSQKILDVDQEIDKHSIINFKVSRVNIARSLIAGFK